MSGNCLYRLRRSSGATVVIFNVGNWCNLQDGQSVTEVEVFGCLV
jgi:hypothetical protein